MHKNTEAGSHWHALHGAKHVDEDTGTVTIISTGHPSTLATYRMLTVALFGEDSRAVAFLDQKIAESPNGADEVVIADETQMLLLLVSVEYGKNSE